MRSVVAQDKTVSAQALFDWANRFARKREAKGHGTQYPTFRQAATRFRVTHDELELTIGEYHGEGYLGMAVGFGISGVGIAGIRTRGDYLIEAYV